MRHAVIATCLLLAACDAPDPPRADDSAADTTITAGPDTASPAPAQPAATASQPAAALRTALEDMLQGPTAAERSAGAESWFSPATAGALRSVDVDSTGHATIDFRDLRPLIPNASSSAGSALLLDELNATVFAVPAIRSAEYRMEASCDAFWEWLQYGCQIVRREDVTG